jgi:hypothetical protein
MVRARLAVPAIGALALASIALLPGPRTASAVGASSTPSTAFETPSIVDPMRANGEPDIGVDPIGRVFSSGPTGTGTQRSLWYASVDGGHTYRAISPGPVPPALKKAVIAPPGGGDTDINFDRSSKQYFTDLYALTCNRTATTTDGGATVNQEVYPAGCSGVPGADRPWLAVFDPNATQRANTQSAYLLAGGTTPLIYQEYNNVSFGAQWTKSTDGLTYLASPLNVPLYAPFGADGYPQIDQISGQVFQAAGYQDPNTLVWSFRLNIGTPDTTGNLSFLDGPTGDPSKLITIANNLAGSPDTLFSVLSMDSSRTLFAVWCISSSDPSKRQVFVSAASAASGWKTWAPAVQVSDGSTPTGDAVNIFPWIKAGNGLADAVWYGQDLNVDPSVKSGQRWNVFFSQVRYNRSSNTITKLTPTPVTVSPHPMHYDDMCLLGSNCITVQGNRNLADFFAVTIDKSGAAEVVYDDTSNGLVQPGFTTGNQQLIDHAGAPVVTVARQSAGLGLFGATVSGPSNAPVAGLSDPAGDALNPVIGGANQPGMDIRASNLHMSGDGQTLKVTMRVVDLRNPAITAATLAATNLQYLTRWQMGNVIYYAAMETVANQPSFYAGKAGSIDLCSVSACFPHVLTYPESGQGATYTGSMESGTLICPASPSANNPCTITINVKTADVGGPTASSLLEEVGGYSLAAGSQEAMEDNGSALADLVPQEIDGVCCYNFKASVNNGGPPPCHEADGEGDVSDGHGGKAHMRFDEDACEDGNPESIQESDASTGDNFQSDHVSAVTFNDALSNVTIAGTGTHNGNPVAYTLVAVDSPAGIGTYNLILSDGYSVSGTLLDGTIQLQ